MRWSWPLALLTLLAPPHASADEAIPWQIQYAAPSGCPSEADFRKALDDRSDRKSLALRAPTHRISISVEPLAEEWTAHLVVESIGDGIRYERTARAARCDELTPALALMVALILDLEPPAPPQPEPPRRSVEPHPASPPPPKAPTPAPDTTVELAFFGTYRSLIDASGRLSVAPSFTLGSGRPSGFSPWGRISAEHFEGEVLKSSGGANLRWTVVGLDLCSHRWLLWGRAYASPCFRIDAGGFEAEGKAVWNRQTVLRPWLTLGLAPELAVPLYGPLWIRAYGGLQLPLLRPWVHVGTDGTLLDVPYALALAGVGLGVRIW